MVAVDLKYNDGSYLFDKDGRIVGHVKFDKKGR